MELLLVPVPIFDKYTAVEAYIFRYREMDAQPEDLAVSPLLQILDQFEGVDAFTGGKPLFVPIKRATLLAEPERQCGFDQHKIVLLVEDGIPNTSKEYLATISHLRQLGFKFALYSDICQPDDNSVGLIDYILLDNAAMSSRSRKTLIRRFQQTDHEVVATGLHSQESFEEAVHDGADLFEGRFYYMPVTKGETKITPIKANLIHLLNIVRDENFEFSTITNIVQRDPALSYSLMRFINSPYLGIRNKIRTIHHAVTILGQDEVRKWVTAAVFRSLGTDRPGELIRLSLSRAKFAENLAVFFGMRNASQSLFLTGMFSTLDVILETSMREALDTVSVSDDIRAALVSDTGPYCKVLDFIYLYERADWDGAIRLMQTHSLNVGEVHNAYVEAISWYNELISEQVRPRKQ